MVVTEGQTGGCSWSSTTSLGSDAFQSHDHQILQLCHHNRSHHYCQDGCHQIPDRGQWSSWSSTTSVVPMHSSQISPHHESESDQAAESYLDLDLHSNESASEDHQDSVESGGSKNGSINGYRLKCKKLFNHRCYSETQQSRTWWWASCGRRAQVLNICPLPTAEKSTTTTTALLLLSLKNSLL